MQKRKLILIGVPLAGLLIVGMLNQFLLPNLNPSAAANVDSSSDKKVQDINDNDGAKEILGSVTISEGSNTQPQLTKTTSVTTAAPTSVDSQNPSVNTQTPVAMVSSTQLDGHSTASTGIVTSHGGGGGKSHVSSRSNTINNNIAQTNSLDDTHTEGGNDNQVSGNNDNSNSQQSMAKAWLKVDANLIAGYPVTAYLLTTYGGPGIAEFRGFHDPDCPKGSNLSCEVVVDDQGSASPTFSGEVPSGCEPCYEYKATFSSGTFVHGENHIESIIRNGNDVVVATAETGFTQQSVFVLPESPIGIIGLMVSAIGGFAVYLKFFMRRESLVVS